jgi:protein-tyrosine phosphatase
VSRQRSTRTAADSRAYPWRRALLWLLFLAPFFFASYGFATWFSARRSDVGVIVFAWEQQMPFLPWTIVPYWLIDLLYGLSLFLCPTRRRLDTHAARLLLTQMLAVACFLLFPLRCTFVRGAVDGHFGWMFEALSSFDQPFNQAPSLHIALLVVLLAVYRRAVPRPWHWLVYAVAGLIAVSVLTTWQHHFFDLPTGAWLGCFVLWLLPDDERSLLRRAVPTREPRRRRLALSYFLAALAVGMLAVGVGGAGLWLLWPAASLGLVGLIYLLFDAAAFAKRADGSLPPAVCCLFAPYLVGAWLNSRWWTRRRAPADEVVPGILLGRLPGRRELQRLGVAAVVDLCAELPCATPGVPHAVVPLLDLITPVCAELERAVDAIDEKRAAGTLLVCCALGFARSAVVLAAWLLRHGLAASPEDAVRRVQDVPVAYLERSMTMVIIND